MKESNLRKTFMPDWQKKNGPLSKLFRNNTGSWIDLDSIKKSFIVYGIGLWRKHPKKKYYRPVGGGDLIGWTSTCIPGRQQVEPCPGQDKCKRYEEMNLRCVCPFKFAVFTSIELKTKGVAMTQDQKDWKAMVIEAGGIAEEVREE